MVQHLVMNLALFPVFAAIQTRHKDARRFICRTGLQFIIRALFRPTFPTGEHIRRRLDIGRVFQRVPFDFLLDQREPSLRVHFLVRHVGELLDRDFIGKNVWQNDAQVRKDGAQPVHVQLEKQRVLPFLDNLASFRFLDRVIKYAFFEIDSNSGIDGFSNRGIRRRPCWKLSHQLRKLAGNVFAEFGGVLDNRGLDCGFDWF